jgi:ribosomal protein S18 acetylase RimI-like enzyme
MIDMKKAEQNKNLVEVRFATSKDLYRIAEMTRALTIHLSAFEWTVNNHLKHVKRRFSNPRYTHIVAVKDNKIIGFTGAELKSTRTAYMMKGYVEPHHRKKGVMRLMEDMLVKTLKKKGVKKIDLRVDSKNKEGKNTWVALGYKTIREIMRKQI